MRIFPILFLVPLPLFAQVVTPGLVDRARRPEAGPPIRTPELRTATRLDEEMGTATPSPGDSDLGLQLLLKREEDADLFRVVANAGVFATDNAARLPVNEIDDVYMTALIGAGIQPVLGNNWFLDFWVSEEIYRYDETDILDFETTDASAGVFKVLPKLYNIVLGSSYHYRRLTDGDFSEESYSRHGIDLTAQKVFTLDRKNSIYTALIADFDLQTDPDTLERFEYSTQIGYDFKLTHTVKLSAYYRCGLRDYQNAPIDEINHLVGVAASWDITEYARFEASASWIDNDSDTDALDYTAGTAGLAASLRVTF